MSSLISEPMDYGCPALPDAGRRGSVPDVAQWLEDLKGRIAILRRIDRLSADNFGDHKSISDGVWELRVKFGPGYRVYYGQQGKTVVLLLCGGWKRSQAADIKRAVGYWTEYQRRQP
jgi:putative addiction module killer protein